MSDQISSPLSAVQSVEQAYRTQMEQAQEQHGEGSPEAEIATARWAAAFACLDALSQEPQMQAFAVTMRPRFRDPISFVILAEDQAMAEEYAQNRWSTAVELSVVPVIPVGIMVLVPEEDAFHSAH